MSIVQIKHKALNEVVPFDAQNHQQFNTNNMMAALALSLGFIPRVTYEIAAMILFADAWIFMLGFI